jgi:hypothetical protein
MQPTLTSQERSRGVELGPRGQGFVRAAIAFAAAKGSYGEAETYADMRWGGRAAEVTKAAIAAATSTGDSTAFAGAATEFFSVVAQASILGRLSGLRRVPLLTRVLTATGATAAWVGEGAYKPVSAQSFTKSSLPPRKVVGVSVVTREMLDASDPAAEQVIRADLVRAVSEAMDVAFIDPDNDGVSDVTPASVTNGVTAVTATASFKADLGSLVTAFDGDLAGAYIVMHPTTAVSISGAAFPNVGARGGAVSGIPVLTSRSVPTGVLALIDPAGVAAGEAGEELRVITQGDVWQDDAVTGTPSLVSLWQTDSVAVVVGRSTNWQVVRPGAVAVITGASYE